MSAFSFPTSLPLGQRITISIAESTKARLASIADRAGFVLLLMAVGALLIRPADLLPSLRGMPIYESLIVACIVVSFPNWRRQLGPASLRRNSVTTLLMLLVPAVVISHLAHADTYDAQLGGIEIGKACLFFLVVVGVIDSPRRLQVLLWVVAACIFAEALLAIMNYRGVLHLPAMRTVSQKFLDSNTSEPSVVTRLCGVGVFNDPNDFSLVLVAAIMMCVYGLGERGMGWLRPLFLVPLVVLGYALVLTHSRGGFLAAGAALLCFLPARFGWRNTIPLAGILFPVLLISLSGRQTKVDIDNPQDTFQTRLELWSNSLDQFRGEPLFGIGHGKLIDAIGYVSHNSYLHAYAEMGILGGTAFAGAFYLVIRGLRIARPTEPFLSQARPYLLAMVASYAVGLLSLSRCYTVPTQLVLALGTAYLLLAARSGPAGIPRFDHACVRRVLAVGFLMLLASYVFLRIMLERGQA